MEFKGKWEYSKSNTGSFILLVDNNYIGSIRQEANAKIIAAAPEMLEMLEKITLVFDMFTFPTEQNLKDYSEEIKQLIKKATL